MKRLQTKLILVGFALVGASFAIFSTVLFTSEWNNLREEIRDSGQIFAEANAGAVFSDYLNFYSNPASGMFERFGSSMRERLDKNRDIVSVSLVGINGRVLFDYGEVASETKYAGPGRFLKDPEAVTMVQGDETGVRDATHEGKTVAEVFVPVRDSSGGHVTTAVYVVSYASRVRRMLELAAQINLALIPTLLLAVLLLTVFSRSLTRPISELNRLAQEVSRGQLDVRLKPSSDDEIGELTVSFERMTADLKASRTKLELYSKNLEQQVAERTVELDRQNQELDRQNRALSRLNKTMVGREVKMIELKKENTALRAELGKPPAPPSAA